LGVDIYLCVPQPKCWGDVSPVPLKIAAPGCSYMFVSRVLERPQDFG